MSLSNPRKAHPVKKWIDWSGSTGRFKMYDKETSTNLFFEKAMYIVVLDELSTIKGFHDASTSGVYSNEVKSISNDILDVKAFKGGNIAKGKYNDIKARLEGGKYAKSVYCALVTGDKKKTNVEMVNISFSGSSLGSWIDAKVDTDAGNVIELSPSTEQLKKGATVYFAPKVSIKALRTDILEKCKSMDAELQDYLKEYLSDSQSEVVISKTDTQPTIEDLPNSNEPLPF